MLFCLFVTICICIVYPILIPFLFLPIILVCAIEYLKDRRRINHYKKMEGRRTRR